MKRNCMAAIGLLVAMTCRSRTSMAAGENLLPNSDFDADLSEWTFPNGSFGIVWTSEDSGGQPDSGSIEIPNRFVFDLASAQSACVSVTGGATYQFSTSAKLAHDSGADGLVVAYFEFYDDAGCESGRTYQEIRFSRQTWTRITRTVTAPANAASARVRVGVIRLSGATDLYARAKFDTVGLVEVLTGGSTTTTLSACSGACGDPVTDAATSTTDLAPRINVTATDALYILETAVGAEACAPCICDVNDSGGIDATDALLALAASVGSPVTLACPQ